MMVMLITSGVTMHKAGFVVDTVSTAGEALAQLAARDYTVVLVEPQVSNYYCHMSCNHCISIMLRSGFKLIPFRFPPSIVLNS